MQENNWFKLIVLVGIFTALVLGGVNALYNQTGNATIISGNSYTGGDLTVFFNATITFEGHTTVHLFTCDYYHIGSQLKVGYEWGMWAFSSPKGC